ncbi:MAG: SDR family oxidoreductase [Deltaproteobacteria bacterium]|nr:SDR family oxidoreductase [Deltaproteobacteria bacterium]
MTTKPTYVGGHGLLKGKNVLITAAAGTGIGFATAIRCAEEGAAALVISDIHERRLGEAADKIEGETGVRPGTVLCNVTKEDEVQAMFELAIEEMGHVDVLMNNAGLGGYAKVVDMTDEQWNLVIDVTLNGCFRCTRAALKHMMPRGRGAIVNNASVLGWRAQEGQSHYAAAKAGVMALTRCAAIEAAERNVRINCVSPSLALHPFLEKVTPPGLLEELQKREAFGRGAEPWEISNVMVFLASDYSSYMTGEALSVSSQRA